MDEIIDPEDKAFPMCITDPESGNIEHMQSGLTIRAEFASRIMAGFGVRPSDASRRELAEQAVKWADALIDALNED